MKRYYIDECGKLRSVTAEKITANYIYYKKSVRPVIYSMHKTAKGAILKHIRDLEDVYEDMMERHQEQEKKLLKKIAKARKMKV